MSGVRRRERKMTAFIAFAIFFDGGIRRNRSLHSVISADIQRHPALAVIRYQSSSNMSPHPSASVNRRPPLSLLSWRHPAFKSVIQTSGSRISESRMTNTGRLSRGQSLTSIVSR